MVGLVLYFMGLPGEMAQVVDKIHSPGKIDIRKSPAMVIASLIAITSGGSAGPEAPLVQVNGSLGSWLGDKLKLTKTSARILTFCGMSAALGAFFGAPIGAALFALEIPHRRGLQYFEAIAPAIIAAIFSFAVFRLNTGITIGGFYHFEEIPALSPQNLFEGLVLGIIGWFYISTIFHRCECRLCSFSSSTSSSPYSGYGLPNGSNQCSRHQNSC